MRSTRDGGQLDLYTKIEGYLKGQASLFWLLYLYGLLLLFTPLYLRGDTISKLGLLLVIGASIYKGAKGGLLSSLWMSIIFFIGLILDPSSVMLPLTLQTIGLYILIAVGLGKSVERFYSQQMRLKESQLQTKALLEAFPDMIFTLSQHGVILDYYAASEASLYLDPDSFIHQKIGDVLPPYLATMTEGALERLFAKREPQIYQYQLEIQGDIRSFESRMVLCGEDRSLAVVRDITSSARAQLDLKESKERIQSILELIPDRIVRYSREGVYLGSIASAGGKLFDSNEDLLGKKITEILSKEDGWRFLNGIQKALETRDLEIVEYFIEGLDGDIWYEARIIPKGEEEVLSLIRDITEEKRAREQILIQHKMGLDLAKITDLKRALPIFLEASLKVSGMDCGCIYLVDRETKDLELALHQGFIMKEFVETISCLGQDSFIASALLEGHPIYSLHRRVVRFDAIREKEGLKALAILPIKSNEEGIACLIVASHSLEATPLSVRTALETITAQMGSILVRIQAEEKIRYVSLHDTLTGLYNRAFLQEEAERIDTKRQLPISVIFGDLNGLKLINDTYGHHLGDLLLIKVAKILRSSCREEEIISRWGGDEFVLLLPKTSQEVAKRICQRILVSAKEERVETIPVLISLGVATKRKSEENIWSIFDAAEDAMYREKLQYSNETRESILSSLLATLKEKSKETEEHIERMLRLGEKIGEEIGLPRTERERLALLITLHDIGKITIEKEILTKTGPLSDKEWESVKSHPQTGYRIAMATEKFAPVAADILAHHEWWDGGGYPKGLKGQEIPLLARICSVVDAYDVMTHQSSYQEEKTSKEAIRELEKSSGAQFDPAIIEVLKKVLARSS